MYICLIYHIQIYISVDLCVCVHHFNLLIGLDSIEIAHAIMPSGLPWSTLTSCAP